MTTARTRPLGATPVRSATVLAVLLVVGPGPGLRAQASPGAELDELIRARIEAARSYGALRVGDAPLYATVMLPAFYDRRVYAPAWIGRGGPAPAADSLARALAGAGDHGLRPRDYHLSEVRALLEELRAGREADPDRLIDLELFLTDAFLTYGAHLLAGRVNPHTIDPEWRAARRDADLADTLERALADARVGRALEVLLPAHSGYPALRRGLERYRAIADDGGWAAIPSGPTLRRGDRGPRVADLRARLRAGGDPPATAPDTAEDAFDDALDAAVRAFQRRHGLEADGAVGDATLAALNVPASTRMRQIELNLERWRWLPQELGRRHVLVNIAAFTLDVVEDGRETLSMRVVVGRPYRRTPVFSDRIRYLVFNPYWHVPPNLAVRDLVPRARQDPGYLVRQNIRVLRGWGAEEREIDPYGVDWSAVDASNFPYRLRQDPGPANALGRVKFMFPNEFNVYLHDTPARGDFARGERAFSSGCIRLERPLELAELLLRDDPTWTGERIRRTLAAPGEQTVPLRQPVPVHLLYWTAWAEPDGSIAFRRDVYDRDSPLDRALASPAPGRAAS